ncbi:MAG: hypothetical protein AAFN68_05530 [Pseudomonadota bacterium]
MAEHVAVESTTKEEVAYKLMLYIRQKEKEQQPPDDFRAYVLDLYAECLQAASGKRQ